MGSPIPYSTGGEEPRRDEIECHDQPVDQTAPEACTPLPYHRGMLQARRPGLDGDSHTIQG